MTNVTYVYSKSRTLENTEKNFPKEFNYGSHFLQSDKNINLKIIVFENDLQKRSFLYYFDRIFQKLFSIPLYSSKVVNLKNLKILKDSDHIFFINESTAFSSMLMLIILKPFFQFKTHLFVMGLYSKKINYKIFKPVHNFLIKFLTLFIDDLMFLGSGELKRASSYHKNKSKLNLFPFHVDTEFWNDENNIRNQKKYILFVGNDGSRNPSIFINLAGKFKNENFLAVSNLEDFKGYKSKNFTLLSKENNNKEVTDIELKEIYLNSKVVIIPLNQTFQPSGQSVALQAMSLGIPVIITKTEGFWDDENFKDNKNIYFVYDNSNEEWYKILLKFLNNELDHSAVSVSAKSYVHKNLNLNILKSQIYKLINKNF